jgi:hypothetical protein
VAAAAGASAEGWELIAAGMKFGRAVPMGRLMDYDEPSGSKAHER